MRYTEARLGSIADELLQDIEKETVNFTGNFDGTLTEPTVLPARLPNLLINGSSGIAVGMATNVPPHNLNEIVEAIIAVIENPEATVKDLMKFVKGPDFPTGGVICGREGIKSALETGRGKLIVRAKAAIESGVKGKKDAVVITEIPYMVNKTNLIESIVRLVESKKVDGIYDIRDESDRDGTRVVVELKKDCVPQVVLKQLFKHTQMQETFGVIMLALVDNQPRVLNLKQLVEQFVEFRVEVVRKRTQFDLMRAKERIHILEGLKKALDHIDAVIQTIRKSADKEQAHANLRSKFKFSDAQATAILDMRLQTLAGLERKKIDDELKEKQALIKYYEGLLKDPKKILEVIKNELAEIKEKNIWVVGADERADKTLYQADLPDAIAWVFGAEGEGMRRLTRESCDLLVRVPMRGEVESLNVSVAAGICLFESVRRRTDSRLIPRGQCASSCPLRRVAAPTSRRASSRPSSPNTSASR
jgi:DNA gyrase subunit A